MTGVEYDPTLTAITGAAQPKCGVASSKKHLVWNGGSKGEKLCGSVWTQHGGGILKNGCDMGIKIKMTQNVCGMGCFLTKKAHVWQQLLHKSTRMVWNGGFISNSIHRKRVLGQPTLCGMGGKSEIRVHTKWVFSNFHFRACYYAFWLRRPPGYIDKSEAS